MYHVANNWKTRPSCCVQCMPEPGWAVVCHVANNSKTQLGYCVQCILEPVSLLCTMWLIITKPSPAVVYDMFLNSGCIVSNSLPWSICPACLFVTMTVHYTWFQLSHCLICYSPAYMISAQSIITVCTNGTFINSSIMHNTSCTLTDTRLGHSALYIPPRPSWLPQSTRPAISDDVYGPNAPSDELFIRPKSLN